LSYATRASRKKKKTRPLTLSLLSPAHAATRDLDLSGGAESIIAILDSTSPPPLQGDLVCYFSPGEARVTGLRTGLARACAARGAPKRVPIGTGRLVGVRVGVDLGSDPPGVTSLEFTIDDGGGRPWRTAVCGGSRAARSATAGGVAVTLPPGAAVSAIGGACAGPDDLRLDATAIGVRATYAALKYPCVFVFFQEWFWLEKRAHALSSHLLSSLSLHTHTHTRHSPGGPDPPVVELKRRTVRGVPIEYAALVLPPPTSSSTSTAPAADSGGGGGGSEWVDEGAGGEQGGETDDASGIEEGTQTTEDDDWAYGTEAEAGGGSGGESAGEGGPPVTAGAAAPPSPPAPPAPAPAALEEGDLWAWDPLPGAEPPEPQAANAMAAAYLPTPPVHSAATAGAASLANTTAAAAGGDPGLWLDWPSSTTPNGSAAANTTTVTPEEEEVEEEEEDAADDPTAGAAAVVTATDPTGFTLLTMILNEPQTAVTLRWIVGTGAAARPVEEEMPLPAQDEMAGLEAPPAAGGGAEQSSAAASTTTAKRPPSERSRARATRVTAWGLVRVADFVVASVLAGAEEAETGGVGGGGVPAPAPAPGALEEEVGGGRPRKPKPSPRPPPADILANPPTTPAKAYRDPGAQAARAFAAARALLLPGGGGIPGTPVAGNASTRAPPAAAAAPPAAGKEAPRRRRGRALADSPGCDGFPDTTCTLACCARHDECYFRHGCTAASWAPTIKRAVGLEGGAGGGPPSPGAAALFLGTLGGKIVAAAAGDAPAGSVPPSSQADVCVECNTNAVACLLAACGPLGGQQGRAPSASTSSPADKGDVCYDSDRGVGCSKFFTCPAAYDANGTALVEDKTADDASAGLGVDGLAAAAAGSRLASAGGVRGGVGAGASLGVSPRPSASADLRRSAGRGDTCECPPTPAGDHTGPCPTAENPCCAHAAIIGPQGCPGETGSVCPTPDAPYPCCCCPRGQVCGVVAALEGSKNGKGGVVHTCVDA